MKKEIKKKISVAMSPKSIDFADKMAKQGGVSRSWVINEILEMVADSGLMNVLKDMKAQQEEQAREGLRAMTESLSMGLEELKKEI